MKQTSEPEKKESQTGTAEQHPAYPKEFRSTDAKPMLIMGFIAIAMVFLWARSILSDSGFRSVMVRSAIVLPVFFILYSQSEKVVFALLPDGINLGDKTLIPCDKIKNVKLRKNYAWIFYSNPSEKEKKCVVNFCNVNKFSRGEAKPALVQWLREHNLQELIAGENAD